MSVMAVALVAAAANAQPGGGPAPVVVAPVVGREVAVGQTFVGSVRPARASVIGAAVDGRVEEFFVNEGDHVTKGQPLVKLRTRTLELERDAAKSMLKMYEQELAELEAGSRPEEIEQARAAMQAADARRQFADLRLKRAEKLTSAGRNILSEDQLDQAQSEALAAKETYLQAKAAYALAVAGPRKERIAQTRAKVQSQAETVQRLDDQLGLHTMRAPFDGYVSHEYTEVGQWLTRGATAVEVVELDEVEVEASVNEEAVGHLRLGVSARVEVAALPDVVFTGTVKRIVPQANARSRTFPVKVAVDNKVEGGTPLLKSNMFAKITLPVGKPEAALLVPKDAIVLGGPSPVVFVVDGGKVKPTPVEIGIADGEWLQVRGPLKPGQVVVVQGNERVMPGQDVNVVKTIGGTSK